jgi:hypothetical protein
LKEGFLGHRSAADLAQDERQAEERETERDGEEGEDFHRHTCLSTCWRSIACSAVSVATATTPAMSDKASAMAMRGE